MIYHTNWLSIHSLKCFKTVWSRLFTSTHCSRFVASYLLDRNGSFFKFLRIPITVVYFKDWNWLSKMVNYISCLVVCKIVFCSEFPDIPDNAGKGRRRRRRTQAIAKRYAFHSNAISWYLHKIDGTTTIQELCYSICFWSFSNWGMIWGISVFPNKKSIIAACLPPVSTHLQ